LSVVLKTEGNWNLSCMLVASKKFGGVEGCQ